jgi:TRAP-type C4-dicarboxylate transport system permease small subunit
MRFLIKAWHAIERLNSSIYTIGAMFILLLAAFTVVDVSGRYLLYMPLQGNLEMCELTMVIVIFFSFCYSFSLHTHIRVDILTLRMSPRMQTLLEVVTSILTLVFLILVVWQGATIAIAKRIEHTDILYIPSFPIAILVPICAALACISLIGHIASGFQSLFKKEKEDH